VGVFYLDEDVSLHLPPLLEARGHDALAAKRYLPSGIPDHEQFATAVRLGRILVTHNRKDFRSLHRAWRDWFAEWGPSPPPHHAGILCIPQAPELPEEMAAEVIDQFLRANPGAGLANRCFRWTASRGWEEIH